MDGSGVFLLGPGSAKNILIQSVPAEKNSGAPEFSSPGIFFLDFSGVQKFSARPDSAGKNFTAIAFGARKISGHEKERALPRAGPLMQEGVPSHPTPP
jgi:hypothetical protein